MRIEPFQYKRNRKERSVSKPVTLPTVFLKKKPGTFDLAAKSRFMIGLNCTGNYDVAKIKMKSVTDHQ